MKAGRLLAAFVGFAGGAAIVVATLALELQARGQRIQGGLSDLQMQSVAVWVLETLPIVLAVAAASMAPTEDLQIRVSRADPRGASSPSDPPEEATGPSVPPPPPLPMALQSADVLKVQRRGPEEERRIKALQELVKVLRSNASRATEESRAKSAYLASMSDQVRGPLSAILGHVDSLQERFAAEDGTPEPELESIHVAARQLVDQISNVLDLSKIDVGALSVVIENVDVAQVVDEVKVALAPVLERTGHQFEITMGPGARFVRGDHGRMRQVLTNLVRHALESNDEGDVTLRVSRPDDDQGFVRVELTDTGRGLPRDETDRLFEGYRLDLASTGGPGLGLAVSRKLSELMGAELAVESEMGEGSTFRLKLPAAEVAEEEVSPRSTVALDQRLQGLPLTLIDQNPTGQGLARYLSESGLEVDFRPDHATALEALEELDTSIAILDAELPGAWDAAKELVERDVKVVVLSLRDEDVEMSLQLGVTAFLTRPVDRELVLATLERCLDEA